MKTRSVDVPSQIKPFAYRAIRILDDEFILRFAFYALLFGVIATLMIDYRQLAKENQFIEQFEQIQTEPVLPSYTPPTIAPGEIVDDQTRPIPEVTVERNILSQKMLIELAGSGVLKMEGTIGIGTAEEFAMKIEGISEYVKTVELNSPGGSVFDALEISEQIREKGWITKVKSGHLCASSCPLIFAGGIERIADKGAAIGVHQIYAIGTDERSAVEAVSGTQTTTAQISRHLEKMGVDPILWLHALETPPQNLFYLNSEELQKFRLTTNNEDGS